MIDRDFSSNTGAQEKQARQLLLENEIRDATELALMSSWDVNRAVNEEYVAFPVDEETWLLIRKDQYDEFLKLVTWIRG